MIVKKKQNLPRSSFESSLGGPCAVRCGEIPGCETTPVRPFKPAKPLRPGGPEPAGKRGRVKNGPPNNAGAPNCKNGHGGTRERACAAAAAYNCNAGCNPGLDICDNKP